ncbi:hypothetical protein CDL15_Pgr017405 [Punica granatum]|uniref:Uncharacterized protein n=1 Tax=Punica granatum TaxID=22663 RepID=A0A218Y2G5_PUNGR|nr:hypothetical protein CDL15_Pgr017405 [Punica granatum]
MPFLAIWEVVNGVKSSSFVTFESSEVLATFLSSTLLPFDSWRLCSLANTAAPGSFVVDQVGTVGYVAFSGIQVLPMGQLGSSGTGSGDLVPLDATSNSLFPAFKVHGGGEGEEEEETVVMVHWGMLQLFISFFVSTDLQTKLPPSHQLFQTTGTI